MRRLKKELRDILADPNEMWTVEPRGDEDLFKWVCMIKGPIDSPYEGGVFYLDMDIPDTYPFRAPKVKFLTPIYHPGVSRCGCICLDILDNMWSPAITIIKLVKSLFCMLADPDFSDPIVPQVSDMYNQDKSLFDKTCREWVRKYAT